MKKLIFIFCLFICIISYAQITFEKSFNDNNWDRANYVIQCNDKGYAILGSSEFVSMTQYMYLIKTDSLGNQLWTKYYPSVWTGNDIEKTSDGGFIILGWRNTGSSYNIYALKIDTLGNIIWSKNFVHSISSYTGKRIIQTSDGGYMIGGTYQVGSGDQDIFLLKLNSNGDSIWTKTYGDAGFDVLYDMKKTNDNGFIIAGSSQMGYWGNYELDLIKLDSVGDTCWWRRYTNGYQANSVYQTHDNCYVVTGYNYGMLLMKIDPSGNVMWNKMLNGNGGMCIVETTDKGLFGIGSNFYYVKTDSSGNTIWENTLPINNSTANYSTHCVQTNDNGFVITGYYDCSLNNKENILLVKMNDDGCICPSINNIFGPHNIAANDTAIFNLNMNYGTDSVNYIWSTLNGQIISGQNTNTIQIKWDSIGSDTLMLVVSNDCGIDSIYYSINILDCVVPLLDSIQGPSSSYSATASYYVNELEGTNPIIYNWSSDIGNIISGNGTDSIVVSWSGVGVAFIQVVASDTCGSDTLIKYVTVVIDAINEFSTSEVSVFPNPSVDNIIIFIPEKATIEIFNINGQIIKSICSISKSTTVDLTDLSSGVYIVRVKTDKEIVTKKIIKEKE